MPPGSPGAAGAAAAKHLHSPSSACTISACKRISRPSQSCSTHRRAAGNRMRQPLLPAAPSPPLAARGGTAPLPAPVQQHLSSSRPGRGPAAAAARLASGGSRRKALRSAAVAWSGPQQEERPLAQEQELGELDAEAGWSEELQREFEAYQAQTPVGGYYPVLLGEQFKDGRYTVLHFLGQGHYSTVWRVLDTESGQHCAMKVVKSAEAYAEAARDEVALLHAIREGDPADAKHCVRLLDQFEHAGPHGTHVCEVFGVMGDDLLTLIRAYRHRGIPLPIVRHLARQTLVALDYLHRECQILHTDVKPENVMLTDTILPNGERVTGTQMPDVADFGELEERLLRTGCKLVDFGNACWTHLQFSSTIQTRQYRAPEVIMGAGYGGAADIWSLGCLVYELATGQYLFNPRTVGTRGRDRDHLLQMMQRLGPMPRSVATTGDHAVDFFSAEGRMWHLPNRHVPYWPLDHVLHEQHGLPEEEAMGLASFLQGALDFDPARRSTAAQLLEHPWLEGLLPQRPSSPPSRLAFWAADDGVDGVDGSSSNGSGGGGWDAAEAQEEERGGSRGRSRSQTPPEGYRHHSPPRQ
ncbi:hypothetical protein ABPG75_005118 [Micractinium tetrahymenae]